MYVREQRERCSSNLNKNEIEFHQYWHGVLRDDGCLNNDVECVSLATAAATSSANAARYTGRDRGVTTMPVLPTIDCKYVDESIIHRNSVLLPRSARLTAVHIGLTDVRTNPLERPAEWNGIDEWFAITRRP